jgi:hypothetical protein
MADYFYSLEEAFLRAVAMRPHDEWIVAAKIVVALQDENNQ